MRRGKHSVKTAAIALSMACSAVATTLHADVFTLSPRSGKGGAGIAADALGGSTVSSEDIEINGLETTLTVKLLKTSFEDCVRTLIRAFPKAKFAANKTSLLMEVKRPNGSLERVYLVRIGGIFPVIQFSMEFPKGLPKNAQWPAGIPRPGGSKPTSSVNLPEKKFVSVSFKTSLPAERVAEDVSADLLSSGWKEFGSGTFIRNNPTEIIIVTARTDDKGVTRGTIIRRPLKK
jgi:hypothetical protein